MNFKRQIAVTIKLTAILAISLLSILQPAFTRAQTPAATRNSQQADAAQLKDFEGRASDLLQEVKKLPEGQAERQAYQKDLGTVLATLEQYKLDKAQIAGFPVRH